MTEQAGLSVAALQARQSQLANQHGVAADADRILVEVLATAHAAMRESLRRLDAIAEEIDRALSHQAELALDTPLGAREFQAFLLAKHHEISAVVAGAHELDRDKRRVLDGLRPQYGG